MGVLSDKQGTKKSLMTACLQSRKCQFVQETKNEKRTQDRIAVARQGKLVKIEEKSMNVTQFGHWRIYRGSQHSRKQHAM